MNTYTQDFANRTQESLQRLKEELKNIRTGRANPAILEEIPVETYGGSTKLKLLELATISTEGPGTLSVSAYDPSTIQDIERAIQQSPLGLSPSAQGGKIMIHIPPLSEEQRIKFTKLTNQKVEEGKIAVRQIRDEVRRKIKTDEESSAITKDDRFRAEKEIDTATGKLMDQMKEIKDRKNAEIMQV